MKVLMIMYKILEALSGQDPKTGKKAKWPRVMPYKLAEKLKVKLLIRIK